MKITTAAFILLVLLTGCAFVENMMNRQPMPDTRIVLPRGQILEVNNFGRLTKTGQDIEDFRCAAPPMVCSGSGVTMDCHCP